MDLKQKEVIVRNMCLEYGYDGLVERVKTFSDKRHLLGKPEVFEGIITELAMLEKEEEENKRQALYCTDRILSEGYYDLLKEKDFIITRGNTWGIVMIRLISFIETLSVAICIVLGLGIAFSILVQILRVGGN